MLFISLIFLLSLLISLAIFIVAFSLGPKLTHRNKMAPFECGFEQNKKPRVPFSMQFFLITLIFLIFDIEFILLLPLVFHSTAPSFLSLQLSLMFLIFIMFLGLAHEWLLGSLNWIK